MVLVEAEQMRMTLQTLYLKWQKLQGQKGSHKTLKSFHLRVGCDCIHQLLKGGFYDWRFSQRRRTPQLAHLGQAMRLSGHERGPEEQL
jgi:hypothetical protein